MKLVVTSAFDNYLPGSEITDPEEVQKFLEERPSSVVKAPDSPKDDPAALPHADTVALSLAEPAKAMSKAGNKTIP